MKKKKVWMAIVAFENDVVFANGCANKRKAESAIVQYLKKNEGFDGKDFGQACFWIGEKDLRLDLMVFEMESDDFHNIQLQAGLMIEPPPTDKNHYRVVYAIDVYGSDTVNAAHQAWKMIRAADAADPVLTLIDPRGHCSTLDLCDVLEFNKVTPGFVTQRFRKSSDDLFKCIWQEFTAGDDVQYENPKGEPIQPPNYDYQELNMTLQSDGHIIFAIREVLRTLDIGGEQSRQFAEEISKLKRLVHCLAPDKEREG